VLLARSPLSSTQDDLARLLTEVKEALAVPIVGAISDGQDSIRKAIAKVLPGVPHPLCQFHYLREAAKPIYEADRHSKKELKKGVRGVRPIERKVEGLDYPQAQAIRGYCAAVQSALTDDGRPPRELLGAATAGEVEDVELRSRPEGSDPVTPTRACPVCGAGRLVVIAELPARDSALVGA